MKANEVFINPSKIELIDGNQRREDGSFFGGIQYIGETLDNLLGECEEDFNQLTTKELIDILNECNVLLKDAKQSIKW